MIWLRTTFDSEIGSHELHAFTREVNIDVMALGNDDETGETEGDDIVVGRLRCVHLLHNDAVFARHKLREVCDQHSQHLLEMYSVMFKSNGDYKPSLNINDMIESALFIEQAV